MLQGVSNKGTCAHTIINYCQERALAAAAGWQKDLPLNSIFYTTSDGSRALFLLDPPGAVLS